VLLGGPLRVGEGLQLMHQALGVDPAQRVRADVELPGVVVDDDRLAQETMRGDGALQRTFGGDAGRVRGHLRPGEAELLEMALPGRRGGELRLRLQLLDHRPRPRACSHMYASAVALTT
jgi:hypothetical protein